MTSSASQYALIASQWPELHAEAVRVEQCALSDPRTACFYARRFDLLLYTLQLTLLRKEPRFARLQKQLRDLAAQLEARANIPQVAGELELIRDLTTDEWWQDVTVPLLEEVRSRLRILIGLIETTARGALYTNFTDELGELRELDPADLLTRDEFQQFRLRARDFLRAHEDHLTMQRLRRNQPLTASDLQELERFLISHGIGNSEVIERAAQEWSATASGCPSARWWASIATPPRTCSPSSWRRAPTPPPRSASSTRSSMNSPAAA